MTTGVSSTAVVSRERKAVAATPSATTSNQSTHVRPRPRRAKTDAATSNTPAIDANSATIVMATTNSRTGHTRSKMSSASLGGRAPVAMATAPTASRTAPMIASFTAPS
jgi:hypothetical protein